MYVILVYDVKEERINKVCKHLRRYLDWVQNSVFEGEITEGHLEKMKKELDKIISKDYDSLILYVFRDSKWMYKNVIGVNKNPMENII